MGAAPAPVLAFAATFAPAALAPAAAFAFAATLGALGREAGSGWTSHGAEQKRNIAQPVEEPTSK